MVSFKKGLGHAQIRLVSFRGLKKNFRRASRPFHMGVPPGPPLVKSALLLLFNIPSYRPIPTCRQKNKFDYNPSIPDINPPPNYH